MPGTPVREAAQIRALLWVLVGLGIAAAFYAMQPVVVPFVLALFFALLARPVYKFLQRYVPTYVAMILVLILIFVLFTFGPMAIATKLRAVAEQIPEYTPRIEAILADLHAFFADMGLEIGISRADVTGATIAIVSVALEQLASVFGIMFLTMFTLIFAILEADGFHAKLALAFGVDDADAVAESIDTMRAKVARYVATKLLLSLLNAVLTAAYTFALGIDFPIVWGGLVFVLNWIPHLGTLFATIPPVFIALVQYDDPSRAIACLIGLVVIYNLVGNLLEPRMLGRALQLSPLVVFVSLMFWGWYWGFIGVVLAVPLTVGIRVVCEQIPALRPVAILLGDRAAAEVIARQKAIETTRAHG